MAAVGVCRATEQQQQQQQQGRSECYGGFSRGSRHLVPVPRPWLSLYGTRVRAVSPVGSINCSSSGSCGDVTAAAAAPADTSLLHRVLPEDLLQEVFKRLPAWALGSAACVCRRWHAILRLPHYWRTACVKAWPKDAEDELSKMVRTVYHGSWRRMWVQRPRLRFEGVYVSRNTYIRCGIAEWRVKNPVHIVCYFRYLRFFPSGKFYYKTTPQFVRDVAKQMQLHHGSGTAAAQRHHGGRDKADRVQVGRYTMVDNEIQAAILYPGLRPTALRLRLRLRSTCMGANNRLDVASLVTCGVGEGEVPEDAEEVLHTCAAWGDDETHNPHVPAVSHSRGTAPFVFVPFLQADTDILNLPVDKMDFYIPG